MSSTVHLYHTIHHKNYLTFTHKADASRAGLSLHLTFSVTNSTKIVAEIVTCDVLNGVGAPYFTDQRLLIFVPEIGGLATALQNLCTACQSDTAALDNLIRNT